MRDIRTVIKISSINFSNAKNTSFVKLGCFSVPLQLKIKGLNKISIIDYCEASHEIELQLGSQRAQLRKLIR